jgi:hypothetical protein
MDNWNYPYRPKWLNVQHDVDIFERHVFWNPETEKWAVRPSDGAVVAYFDDPQAAIDHAYQLSTEIDDDWCDIVVFDQAGNEVEVIDPEENLELSDRLKDLLRRDMEGKLNYVSRDKQPNDIVE